MKRNHSWHVIAGQPLFNTVWRSILGTSGTTWWKTTCYNSNFMSSFFCS